MVHSCLSTVFLEWKKKSNQIRSLINICLPVWLDMLVTRCLNEQNKEDSSLFLSLYLSYFGQPLLWMVVIEKGSIEGWKKFDYTALSEIFRGLLLATKTRKHIPDKNFWTPFDRKAKRSEITVFMWESDGRYIFQNWILHNLRIATLK